MKKHFTGLWLALGAGLLMGCTALAPAEHAGQRETAEWTVPGMKSGAAPGPEHDRMTAATLPDASRGRALSVGRAGQEGGQWTEEEGTTFRFR